MTTTADDVLAKLGLQARMTPRDYIFPALGIFGLGLVVGAGVTVMLSPQVRQRVRQRFERGTFKVKQAVGSEGSGMGSRMGSRSSPSQGLESRDLEDLSRDELYERAQSMNIETHANMSKSDLIHAIAGS